MFELKNPMWCRICTLMALCCTFVMMNGCNECRSGASKCDGNRIMECAGSDAEKQTWWRAVRDCDDFGATCKNGIFTEYTDYKGDLRPSTSSCVTQSYECGESQGYFCTEHNEYVVNCVITSEGVMVAAIGVENWESRPYCVYAGNRAAFAHAEGTCEKGEEMCDTEGRKLRCIDKTWQLSIDTCSQD